MEIKGIKIEYLGHSGFHFSNGKSIVVDPYNLSNQGPKADLVLITHSHFDHCSIKDIELVKKEGTVVVIPADAQSKITRISGVDMQIIEPGDELTFGNVKVTAVPAYNVNKDFHPKREGWMGFIIKLGGVIIYHAGDSDKIPEMRNLTGYGKHGNEFVALLPVSGKYVMDAEEAAEVASIISPDLVIPMHYGAGVAGTREDAEKFVKLCKEKGLKAEILDKI
ncbi:MAG: MBL fold metallo-hydrolase [Nanoarchaeota archaeon]|nr:MBL fold metallo-hydrolase [Nanoarchaeota archaeon]MBU0977246.1 MBL fold metallo-hydrolase [Nanoarchaeota archaeon]